jgi:ribonuclease VapC
MEGGAGWQRDGVVVIWVVGAELVPFDCQLARVTAELRQPTRNLGLSLGDRACLALARVMGGRVLTADRCWAGIS